MDATRAKDRQSDCTACGDSDLVRAGNSYWMCKACAPPPPPKKKTTGKKDKIDADQPNLDGFF